VGTFWAAALGYPVPDVEGWRVPERKDYGYVVVMADPEGNEFCVD
jgi:hypothetical protein